MDSIKSNNHAPLLKAEDLSVAFGNLKAVANLQLQVKEGELFGLIGPNGAGKTTVFNAITGAVPISGGAIHFADQKISGLTPHQVTQLGIVRMFQSATIFPQTHVGMHIMTGLHCRTSSTVLGVMLRTRFCKNEEMESEERMHELLKFASLVELERQPAADLTWAQQKRLMLATALATQPKLILLDEPVAGMNAAEIEEMIELINKIRADGVTVFIIDHNMKVMMKICDRIMVMNAGQNLTEGAPEEVAHDPRVIEAYLGYKHT